MMSLDLLRSGAVEIANKGSLSVRLSFLIGKGICVYAHIMLLYLLVNCLLSSACYHIAPGSYVGLPR